MTPSKAGLTLVELLVVVIILGILAAITIPRYVVMRTRALRATVVSDLRSLAASQEIYHLRHDTYAATAEQAEALASESVTLTIGESGEGGWSATATHEAVVPASCAYYYGDAAPVSPATRGGVVDCDF